MEALAPQVEMTVVAGRMVETLHRGANAPALSVTWLALVGTYKRSAGYKRQVDDH